MKQNWIRNLLRGLSFTSVMFVFQACYGPPQDFGMDVYIEGQVKSMTTGEPIPGIKVSIPERLQYEYTNAEGRFSLYTERFDSYTIRFEDVDSVQNGKFIAKDTVLTGIDEWTYLDIVLEGE